MGEEEGEEGVISFNDIETECPVDTICVESFFCAEFSGNSVADQIPCLITSGGFTGDFGICCNRRHPRVCPEVRSQPKPEHCSPRPLGDPPDEECPSDGVSSSCPAGSLCCFNGCINVCLEDPPHSVQTAFWRRRMGFEVKREPKEGAKKPKNKQPNKSKNGGQKVHLRNIMMTMNMSTKEKNTMRSMLVITTMKKVKVKKVQRLLF